MTLIHTSSGFSCTIEEHGTTIIVTLQGRAQAIDMLNIYYEAIDVANINNSKKLLLDMHQLHMCYESFEMINLLRMLAPKLAQFKVARVVNNQHHKNYFLAEMVAKSPLSLCNFDNEASAKTWLLSDIG